MKFASLTRALAPALLCLLLPGCVLSLQPLFTKESTVFRKELIGTWTEKDNSWDFKKDGSDNDYLVTLTEGGDKVGKFDGVLVEIDGKLFLDLYPRGPEDWKGTPYWKFHFLKAHTFLHVQEIGPKLKMRAMNPEWMNNHLAKNPDAIRSITQDDRPILTASTAELQKFMAKLAAMKTAEGEKGPFGPFTALVKKD